MPRSLIRRLLAGRGFAWLIWLALALPLAQSIAAGHELSHLRSVQSLDWHSTAPLAHCDDCLAAAAIGGAACAAAANALPPAVAARGIAVRATGVCVAVAPRHYASRAPPLLVR